MKKLRWPLFILLVAVTVVGWMFSQKQTAVQPPQLVEETPAPVTGGVYVEALVGSPSRWNPLLDYYNVMDRDVDRLVYSSLLRFDAQGMPQPDLAESWGISRDFKIYNLSLRQDALWHDGLPVTSQDVLFTIELMRNSNLPVPPDIRSLWKTVKVKAFDEHTIQFSLPEPFAPFLDYLTFQVLPKHIWEHKSPDEIINAAQNLEPVGSGPYRFDHVLTDGNTVSGVALTTNPDYYGTPAYIEQVVFKFYPNAEDALAAYRTGEVMGIGEVTSDILPQVLAQDHLNVYTSRLPQLSMVLFNLNNPQVPFFQDVVIRKALMQGINRQWIIDRLLDGQALMADGPIFPNTWAYFNGMEHIDYNPTDAVDALRKAGYLLPAEGGAVRELDGQALKFELLYPDDDQHALIAQNIQHDWERLGVQVDLKAVSYQEMLSNYLNPRSYQAALVDINLSRSPDPDPYPFWHQTQVTGGQNYAQWDDRQASEYLEQARITVDPGERAKLYHNFQVLFMRELPALPLFYPVYTYAIDDQVLGVSVGPMFDPSDRFITVNQWYLVSKSAGSSTAAQPSAQP